MGKDNESKATRYIPHSERGKHYWKIRRKDFRKLCFAKGWMMKGAFAEKFIGGTSIVQTIVAETDDYYICCFQRKDNFSQSLKNDEIKHK